MSDIELIIKIPEETYQYYKKGTARKKRIDIGLIEQAIANGIPVSKDPYDTRLKADMSAMLSNIQLEIENKKRAVSYLLYDNLENAVNHNAGIDKCINIIQNRINEIKSEE